MCDDFLKIREYFPKFSKRTKFLEELWYLGGGGEQVVACIHVTIASRTSVCMSSLEISKSNRLKFSLILASFDDFGMQIKPR